jgi:hypothetical protein
MADNTIPTPAAPLPTPQAPTPTFNVAPVPANPAQESHFFRISIRSLLSIILTASFCTLIFLKIPVPESLTNLVVMAVTFYFGAKITSNGGVK